MPGLSVINITVNISSIKQPGNEFTITVRLNDKYIDSNDFDGSLNLPAFIQYVVSKSVSRLIKRYLENG